MDFLEIFISRPLLLVNRKHHICKAERRNMLNYTKEKLVELGAEITTREIYQQPQVWQTAFENYKAQADEIVAFLNGIDEKHDYIKVILTGAGTSAYVGDTLVPYFRKLYDERKWNFNAIATTDIVANPLAYLHKEVPTVLVSFARSGNSPESVATVDLAICSCFSLHYQMMLALL